MKDENERIVEQDRAPGGRTLMAFLRDYCRRRGWNLGDVARRAGLSRTTLYHLERGKTRRPHGETLRKLAAALEMAPEALWENMARPVGWGTAGQSKMPSSNAEAQRRFDRTTNPAVAEVHRDSPRLFAGWSADEWDELYSTFGTGGPLTRDGVVETAAKINRKRETVQQLHIILDTHLGDVATHLIDALYRMARNPSRTFVVPDSLNPRSDGSEHEPSSGE